MEKSFRSEEILILALVSKIGIHMEMLVITLATGGDQKNYPICH